MMGGGALSPKGIIQSISAKGGELMQGRRSQGFLSSDVSIQKVLERNLLAPLVPMPT